MVYLPCLGRLCVYGIVSGSARAADYSEGYSSDYRELDATNPGGFHRGQILHQAWKSGTEAP
jgi:hypothetical protein